MYNVSFNGWDANLKINPVAFTIGKTEIYWYSIIIVTGLLLALFYCYKNASKYDVKKEKFIDCVLIGIVTGIIGARLYYVLFNWEYFGQNPGEILKTRDGGLAIYGGIIGALIGGLIIAKIHKMNILAVLDLSMMGFLIGQGIGRWGNFLNQEAFGTPTNLPWGMISENTNGVAVHPCFLYESLWCILGFLLIHFLRKNHQKYKGQVFFIYLAWYGFERMVVEGLRTDSLYLPFTVFGNDVRVSQLVSLIIFIAGITLLIINRKRKDKFYAINN